MSRRIAREYVAQFLYTLDFNKDEDVEELLLNFFESRQNIETDDETQKLKDNDKQFIIELIQGTLSKLTDIDAVISANSLDWTLDRIARVDLSILRMAVYEIMYRDDIPDSVTANEAIELAKRLSTEESGSFINGIVGKVIKDKNKTGE